MQFCPHFDIPLTCLLGYLQGAGGTLALIKMSLRLFCLLNAVKGGSLKKKLDIDPEKSLLSSALLECFVLEAILGHI